MTAFMESQKPAVFTKENKYFLILQYVVFFLYRESKYRLTETEVYEAEYVLTKRQGLAVHRQSYIFATR